jgi:hypothetical protein
MGQKMNANTMEVNYNNAKKEIRTLGVKVKVNVMECCRGCITEEKLALTNATQPHIYTYGGQDNAISWVDGRPYWRSALRGRRNRWLSPRDRDLVGAVYFNHGNLTPELGQQIVAIFEKHGFVVDWDGTEFKCIEIDFERTEFNRDFDKAIQSINTDYAQC